MLTQQRLKELLHYDPETGIFTRKIFVKPNAKAGDIAGFHTPKGYLAFYVDKKRYLAHRIAWLYMTGSWPKYVIDHIDAGKDHNWFSNLQDITNRKNLHRKNHPNSNNTSGFVGVHYRKDKVNDVKKYEACIQANDKKYRLGYFLTPEEASEAYQAAKLKHHHN